MKNLQILALSVGIILLSLKNTFDGPEMTQIFSVSVPLVRTVAGAFAAINIIAVAIDFGRRIGSNSNAAAIAASSKAVERRV